MVNPHVLSFNDSKPPRTSVSTFLIGLPPPHRNSCPCAAKAELWIRGRSIEGRASQAPLGKVGSDHQWLGGIKRHLHCFQFTVSLFLWSREPTSTNHFKNSRLTSQPLDHIFVHVHFYQMWACEIVGTPNLHQFLMFLLYIFRNSSTIP